MGVLRIGPYCLGSVVGSLSFGTPTFSSSGSQNAAVFRFEMKKLTPFPLLLNTPNP